MEDLKQLIREVPDFPKPGILFYDITTLLKDKWGFRSVIDGLRHHYRDAQVDIVLGIEARSEGSSSVTRSTVSMMFALGWRLMMTSTAGLPLAMP